MAPPVAFSPYDYRIHEDPYPVYARLRDEAPLYRNDELDFWALSRHQDPAELAAALAAAGHPVALGARRADRCEELAAAIRADRGEAIALPLDVTDDAVKTFAVAVTDRLGPVEILVNSAGDLDVGQVHELDPAEFAWQIEVNLVGAHRMVSAFVPRMVARQRGDVVFVSSDVTRAPRPRIGRRAVRWHAAPDGARRFRRAAPRPLPARRRPGPALVGRADDKVAGDHD